MKHALIIAILIAIASVFLVLEARAVEMTASVPEPHDYHVGSQVIAIGTGDVQYCRPVDGVIGETENAEYTVEVIFTEIGTVHGHEIGGQYDPVMRQVRLHPELGTNVNVIAHEVSHLVDHLLLTYPQDDPHYEAYFQGVWTQCVYDHMKSWSHTNKARALLNQLLGY